MTPIANQSCAIGTFVCSSLTTRDAKALSTIFELLIFSIGNLKVASLGRVEGDSHLCLNLNRNSFSHREKKGNHSTSSWQEEKMDAKTIISK